MNVTDRPAPELRIGDFERHAAASQLQQHFTAGRLDWDELDGRLTAAYAAKTYGELETLFTDLPMLGATPAVQAGPPAGEPKSAPYRVADLRLRFGSVPTTLLVIALAIGLTVVTATVLPLILLWWLLSAGGHKRMHFGNPYARGGSRYQHMHRDHHRS